MLYLSLRRPGGARHWPLAPGNLLLGRAPECDIVVDDPSISRRHLRIAVTGDGVELEDLGSSNGLFVEGIRVERARVEMGQWFSIGSLLFAIGESISVSGSGIATDTPQGTGPARDGHTPPAQAHAAERILRRVAESASAETLLDALLESVASESGARGAAVHSDAGAAPALIASWGTLPPWPSEGSPGAPPSDGARVLDIGGVGVLVAPFHEEGRRLGFVTLFPASRSWDVVGLDSLLAAAAAIVSRRSLPAASNGAAGAGGTDFATEGFLASATASRALLEQIDRLAPTTLPVLLIGESGTGKELLAARLHRRSTRRDGPFVALNCSAFPKDLVEAELFGIHRGVATGVGERAGRFQQATGGTLLLDEIGDLALDLQPKLLRALESGEVLPVGAPRPVAVDVRVVAATHMDLARAAAEGRFRQDLLFRIAGARVTVPPLRERPEDILPLARHFARQAAREQSRPFWGIDVEAAKLLIGYVWPGNVRELRHVLARAVALADGPVLAVEMLPPELRDQADVRLGDALLGLREDWRSASDRFARLYFTRLLERCAGNLSEAARIAGIGRSTLYAKLQELGLPLPER